MILGGSVGTERGGWLISLLLPSGQICFSAAGTHRIILCA
jgi:hypothetical protein